MDIGMGTEDLIYTKGPNALSWGDGTSYWARTGAFPACTANGRLHLWGRRRAAWANQPLWEKDRQFTDWSQLSEEWGQFLLLLLLLKQGKHHTFYSTFYEYKMLNIKCSWQSTVFEVLIWPLSLTDSYFSPVSQHFIVIQFYFVQTEKVDWTHSEWKCKLAEFSEEGTLSWDVLLCQKPLWAGWQVLSKMPVLHGCHALQVELRKREQLLEQQSDQLTASQRVIAEQEEELAEVTKELQETERENTLLRQSMDKMLEESDYSRQTIHSVQKQCC